MTDIQQNRVEEGTGYGVDVAVTRMDDVDRKLIAHIATKKHPRVLDVGCGAGGQSSRMAAAGAQVLGIDISDFSDAFETLRKTNLLSTQVLQFEQADMTRLQKVLQGRIFDDCCMQRVLHYVPYPVALQVLSTLRACVKDRLYISVTGLGSAIGTEYADTHKNVATRFCRLQEVDAVKFSIHEPVCLYTQEEFVTLLETAGWKVETCWVSAFGNVKAVCV